MTVAQILLAAFALSLVAATLAVVGQSALGVYRALRVRRFGSAALCFAAGAAMIVALAAVLLVWFAYGVAHAEKTPWRDFRVVLATGIPFFAVAWLLWRIGRRLVARL